MHRYSANGFVWTIKNYHMGWAVHSSLRRNKLLNNTNTVGFAAFTLWQHASDRVICFVFEIHGSQVHCSPLRPFSRRNFPSAAVARGALPPRCCRHWHLRAPRSPQRASRSSVDVGALDPSSCCSGSASPTQSHSGNFQQRGQLIFFITTLC